MQLHYRKIGEGEPLFILHGLFGSADNWNTLAKKFSENYLVYTIDLRNHGLSPHSKEWSYAIMADDVLKIIDDEKLQRINIIGHSMGGKVAMNLAMNHPEKIKNLIVVDISPRYYPPHHQEIIQAILEVDLEAAASRKDAENTLRKYIKSEQIVQFLLKNLYWKEQDFEKKLAWRMNIKTISEKIEEVGLENIPDRIDYKFKFNTAFIKGSNSNYILEKDEETIMDIFPNAKIESIQGAGHWVQAEKPLEFYDAIIKILKE